MAIATIMTTAGAETLSCAPGESAESAFTVSNDSGRTLQLSVETRTDDPSLGAWLQVDGAVERDLPESSNEQVKVKISVPADAAPGTYAFRLRVYDRNDPEQTAQSPSVGIQVEGTTVVPPPPPPPPPSRLWLWITIGAVAVVVIGIGLYFALRSTTSLVPDLEGKTLAEAEGILEEVSLSVGNISEKASSKAVDTIIDSKPVKGTEVEHDTEIAVVLAAAPPPPRTTCADAVQGKIAWNYTGSKRWAKSNIDNLCKGREGSAEPAKCFQQVMHGGVNYGGGTRWMWQNALNLCKGSANAKNTVNCFTTQIRQGKTWQQAIPACNRTVTAVFDMKLQTQKFQTLLNRTAGKREVPRVDD